MYDYSDYFLLCVHSLTIRLRGAVGFNHVSAATSHWKLMDVAYLVLRLVVQALGSATHPAFPLQPTPSESDHPTLVDPTQ